MSTSITFNGVSYSVPAVGEETWGDSLSNYFIAIPQGALQKTGGTFLITSDVNFGANYGLLSKYFTTRTANASASGQFRLAVTDSIGWRNNANSGNLLLSVNGSDQLTFNGSAVYPGGITALTGDVTATGPGSVAATVALVGGVAASGVAAGANLANAATPLNTISTIVMRDSSGNFAAGNIRGTFLGAATGNTTYTANQYGVVLSGAANAMSVLAPDPSVIKVLTSGGSGANPTWQFVTADINLASFGSTPNASGGTVASGVITLQPADGSNPGGLTAGTQTIGGVKTFSSLPVMSGLTASQVVVSDSGKALASVAYATGNAASAIIQRDGVGNFAAATGTFNSVAVTGLTASQAVVTDSSKNLASVAYTNANTASALVQRDSNGSFSAATGNFVNTNISALTASQAVVTDGSKLLSSLSYVSTATASTLVSRDSNANTNANNIALNYATTVTAASNTTLAVGSPKNQYFTGSSTQSCILPDATTLPQTGFQFYIDRKSVV